MIGGTTKKITRFHRLRVHLTLFLFAFGIISLPITPGLAEEPAVNAQSDSRAAISKVVAQIPIVGNGLSTVVSPDSVTLYLSVSTGVIDVIDTATNTIRSTISMTLPGALAISPDGSRLYVAEGPFGNQAIAVVDTSSNTTIGTVTVSTNPDIGPINLAVTPDGKTLYVLSGFFATTPINGVDITIIDTATLQISGTLTNPDGLAPGQLILSPDGAYAYVIYYSGPGNSTLQRINTATQESTFLIQNQFLVMHGMAIAPDGKTLYFVHFINHPAGEHVAFFNLAKKKVEREITLKSPVRFLSECAVTPDGKFVYCAYEQVAVINTTTGNVAEELNVPDPLGISISPNAKYAYSLGSSVSNNTILYVIKTQPED